MARTPKTQSEKATLAARRAWCYLVLVLISFLCLFFFYVLVINSTRTHFEIQKGFSLLPGKSLVTNFRNVLADANIPVGTGIRNSLIVSACSAALSVYFSALTAYGIYAYNFRFKKAAFAIILLIMTMPTQVSALGFLQLITKMGLKNSFVPLILPSIAAPTVFFFMKQYLDASLPMEIVEAARIDGAGEFYTFNKIVLPIMKPALAVQAIFSFVDAAGPAAFVTYVRAILLRDTGATISPFAAFLLLQGVETLSLRLERHAENTKKVVEFLANHPQVEHVNHPSLPNHPDHALYEKYFPNGGGSIFTFEIKGGVKEAHKFIDNLKIFSLLANVADVKSLVIHPASTTHSQLTDAELAEQQIYQNTIRLSIGTEHIDDIIADLEAGFAAVRGE